MNPVQTFQRDQLPPVRLAPQERRPIPVAQTRSAFSECTCPGDCDRDHDNE
jgi:hypothetical protein